MLNLRFKLVLLALLAVQLTFAQFEKQPTLWLDASKASSLTKIGNVVESWNDLSGQDNHACQANTNNRPTLTTLNGVPAIEFTGLQFLDIPHDETLNVDTTDGYQLFVVGQIFSDHTNADFRTGFITKFWSGTGGGGLWGLKTVLSNGIHVSGINQNSGSTFIQGNDENGNWGYYNFADQLSVFSAWYDPSTGMSNSDANGGLQYANNYPLPITNNTSNVRIGNRNAPYQGNDVHLAVCEILYFPSKLSPTGKAEVEEYLNNKWQKSASTYNFDPYQLPVMPTLWVDASDSSTLQLSGNLVEAWHDKSGHGWQALPADPSARPTLTQDNGLPMIEFIDKQYLDIPHDTALCINTNEGYQVLAVAKIFEDHTNGDSRVGIIHKNHLNGVGAWGIKAAASSGTQMSGLMYSNSYATFRGDDGQFYDFGGERNIFTTWYNPTTARAYALADGGRLYVNECPMALQYNDADVRIGNRGAGTGLDGVHLGIHEILFFPRMLKEEERIRIEAYLANKWNIDLPIYHPYTSEDPYNGNIALGAAVNQSSDASPETTADKALDQARGGVLAECTVSSTTVQPQAWWEVDLGEIAAVDRINIWNRTDGGEIDLVNYYVLASDVPFSSTDLNTTMNQAGVIAHLEIQQAGRPSYIAIEDSVRYIRIQLVGTASLSLAEVEVIGKLSDTDRDGISNQEEQLLGTNPENNDTDADGVLDGIEIGMDINNPLDSDGDGYIDALESTIVDTDDDGVVDQVDIGNIDPCIPNLNFGTCDQDKDGLTNDEEMAGNSNPLDPCDPNPINLGCTQTAQPGGFYYEWDDFDPLAFGEKDITFDNTGLTSISMAPPYGVHPRVFFSPEDIPDIIDRMNNTVSGQKIMQQIHAYTTLIHLGYSSCSNPPNCYNHAEGYAKDSDGNRLISNAGLWDSHEFYYNLINRVPDPLVNADAKRRGILASVMTIEAFECMVKAGQTDPDTGLDYDTRAEMLAEAMAYWAETEINNPVLNLANRGLLGDNHFALAYDINYNNMNPAQRDIVRAGIARMIDDQVLYGYNVEPYATTSNWASLNSFELYINLSIEGEEGYKPEITEEFCRVYRNFITYGWYESGAPYEGLGKNYQFNTSIIAMAKRGYSLLGHPHVRNYMSEFIPAINQPFGAGFIGTDAWGGTGPDPILGKYKLNAMDILGAKWMMPNNPAVDLAWRSYIESSTVVPTTGYVYQQIEPRGYFNGLLCAAIYAKDYQAGDYSTQGEAAYTEEDLSFFAPIRGLATMRSSGSSDAMLSHFHCRQDLGGHTYADRNNFTLSSHGRIWVRYAFGNEIPETNAHSCIVVNDIGSHVDNRNGRVPGRVTDFQEDGTDVQISGDATYPYSWEWMQDASIPSGWTQVTETPNDFQYQPQPESYYDIDYYNRGNWNGPEGVISGYVKRPFNTMEKVYRTVAMARGDYPFLLVVDDIKKDNNINNYKWLAQIASDLSIESTDVNLDPTDYRHDIILQEANGTRKLLVRVLDNKGYIPGTAPAYTDQFTNFRGNICDRLVIEADVVSPDFKVLFYPYDAGQPLPITTYDSTTTEWTVSIGNQVHYIDLEENNGKTLVDIYQEEIRLDIKAFLAGPFDNNAGMMEANLAGILPESQPYAAAPWNYSGNEMRDLNYVPTNANDEIVDWVLLEALDKNDPSTVLYTKAALLQRDGDVVEPDGFSPLVFRDLAADEYYIGLRHRNHLDVRTSSLISLSSQAVLVDFTTTPAYGTNAQATLNNVYALFPGDVTADDAINAADRSATWNGRNQTGYLMEDANLSGSTNAADRSITWNYRNKAVQW